MALPNEIQTQNLGVMLQRHLGVVSAGSPAPTLAASIIPTLAAEVDRFEWGFLRGQRECHVANTQLAGGVGTFATLQLRNLAGSGILAVVRSITVLSAAGGPSASAYLTAASFGGTVLTPGVRDTRWAIGTATTGKSGLSVSKQATVINPAEPEVSYFPGGGADQIWTRSEEHIVITPGWQLWIQANTADTNLAAASISWYELAPLQAELAQIG